jgi:hypothetical protein
MHATWRLILVVLAVVLFFIATVVPQPEPWYWRSRFIAAGLFCWCLSTISIS